MEKVFAKALYDNTAESKDELAFRKGDVVVVIEQNPDNNVGWWKCSLNGQKGLAPANRLRFISPEVDELYPNKQNIYQIPKVPQPSEDISSYQMEDTPSTVNAAVYDVPRRVSVNKPSAPQPLLTETTMVSPSDIWNTCEMVASRNHQSNVYAVPASPSKDPNYDIPVPSHNKRNQIFPRSYSTLPNPQKSEWLYDMPVAHETSICKPGSCGMLHFKYATANGSLYDFPKPSAMVQQKTQPINPESINPESIYDVPATFRKRQDFPEVLSHPKQKIVNTGSSEKVEEPLEYRGKQRLKPDPPPRRSTWGRNRQIKDLGSTSKESEVKKGIDGLSVSENQRISILSTSSTTSSASSSSRDSLMLDSSSSEPLKEISLSQEVAGQRLLELQEAVCKAVPKLMNFVSSYWRKRDHLCQHLQEIREASEDIANSVTCFLNFALDVRGNAQQLTDSSLQARLLNQLSVVEDSGLILQKTVNDLGHLGWPLDALTQDLGQAAPDQLDRFVMLARTVPEDVKRLVSIVNANGKLLFRNTPKEPETPKKSNLLDVKKIFGKNEPPLNTQGEDDYVQLQTLPESEKQQLKKARENIKLDKNEEDKKKETNPPCSSSTSQSPSKPQISDHCRLYFGAIKKATAVFVTSLEEGQPPEKFISHSKLVIMVGQRLIDTLWGEAQKRQDSQELLSKSNHLCALLKQLAVATKEAAVHYPDKVAIHAAQDTAKQLYYRAHHFRVFLEA